MTVFALPLRPVEAPDHRIAQLSPREREILTLMARGYSNAGICQVLHVSDKTVEAHVRSIFRKLDIPARGTMHRRVLAVLIHLDCQERGTYPDPPNMAVTTRSVARPSSRSHSRSRKLS